MGHRVSFRGFLGVLFAWYRARVRACVYARAYTQVGMARRGCGGERMPEAVPVGHGVHLRRLALWCVFGRCFPAVMMSGGGAGFTCGGIGSPAGGWWCRGG